MEKFVEPLEEGRLTEASHRLICCGVAGALYVRQMDYRKRSLNALLACLI